MNKKKERKWLRLLLSAFISALLIELYVLRTGNRLPSETSTLLMLFLALPVYFTVQLIYRFFGK